MINQTHTPQEHKKSIYLITGDSIQEIIDFIIPRIRACSQEFYKKELKLDLENKGESLVDSHAGQGTFYNIEFTEAKRHSLNV